MTTATTETLDQAPAVEDPNLIILDEFILRGQQQITELRLRKPKAGELRGVSLSDLLSLDVAAIIKVVPRISLPSITEAEARSMDPADLVQIGAKISSFLLKKSLKEELSPGM
ncbi:phage tail assembly protein [Pseudomonas asuensis]|uniref:Tail protein n=1 Tax=Pseudomonas asuensis TaxID=1825787 RepID=A0ABQ2H2U1_9PSED|nr:phage tail assembly protein [Pseudomonas asuensis]GGM30211.1 tail protein [Pseudomonas asuensis]